MGIMTMTKWERVGIVMLFLGLFGLLMGGIEGSGSEYLALAVFIVGGFLLIWRDDD